MSLTSGRSLNHYRLIDPIGEGGMGVVWRATDSELGRDVAIKVLPDLFVNDPERLARFEREARLLASLNHPHIASIFGLHSADGVRFLAMELVEGEDLAQRIEHGPLPVAEALPLALQIAQALEHAHEKGVIHRDLKPANVKLTSGGQAKVLDFGLAKALEGDASRPASSAMMSQSPTITGHLTGANVLLGTAAYMAPEQARGHAADKRADIWAFGALVMEMLTGRRLFEGETISDTLASVLKTDPDWSALPKETPARIRELLRRCLERNPKQRLRDIGEARILIEQVLAGGAEEPGEAGPLGAAPRRGVPIPILVAAGFIVGVLPTLVVTNVLRPRPVAQPLLKFQVAAPGAENPVPAYPAVSPDGRMVTFVSGGHIWLQKLGELEPRDLVTDAQASDLFWSPDSRTIGYITGTRIMKVDVGGGESQAICDARATLSGGRGAFWTEDGSILFSRGDSAGVMKAPALGGDPSTIVRPDTSETDLHEPAALPGGRGILFCGHRKRGGISNVTLWTDGKRRVLVELPGQSLARPIYARSGHILFQRSPTTPGLWAVPFSLAKLETTGPPFLVAADGHAGSVSNDGVMAYLGGSGAGSRQMIWMDRQGKETGAIGEAANQLADPVLSADGRLVANSLTENDNSDLWVYDVGRETRTRLTFDPANDAAPQWSPTGDRVAYHSQVRECSGPSCWRILIGAADGTGRADTVAHGAAVPRFTPDGRQLVVIRLGEGFINWDLVAVDLAGDRALRPLVIGNPRVMDGNVSPDGRWMAYMSDESSEWQIYLTRFPGADGRWQVSVAGGQWAQWNARGDRLYFVQGEDLMEVEVSGSTSPILGRPQRLFTRPAMGMGAFNWYRAFAVAGDGSRFALVRSAGEKGRPPGVTVVQNWLAEFAKKK